MSKDLTTSEIDRQNILNNRFALAEIEKAAGIQGIPFEGQTVVFKEQVAAFFEVTPGPWTIIWKNSAQNWLGTAMWF